MAAYFETRTGLGLGLGPKENPDSGKTRTRARTRFYKKPGLDNRKPGLQIENTGFDETGF